MLTSQRCMNVSLEQPARTRANNPDQTFPGDA
jgi:hypothetical protein